MTVCWSCAILNFDNIKISLYGIKMFAVLHYIEEMKKLWYVLYENSTHVYFMFTVHNARNQRHKIPDSLMH